jgi:hypothetical protein
VSGGTAPCIRNLGTSWRWGLLHAQVTLPKERKNALYPISWRIRASQSALIKVQISCRYRVSNKGSSLTQPFSSSYTNWASTAFVTHLVLYTHCREITLLMACLHSILMINNLSLVSSQSLLSSESEDEDRGEPCLYLLHPREIREMTEWSQWTNLPFNKKWVSCLVKIRMAVITLYLKSGSVRSVAGVRSVSFNTVLANTLATPVSSGWNIMQWAA